MRRDALFVGRHTGKRPLEATEDRAGKYEIPITTMQSQAGDKPELLRRATT
jgi:hypothetical protein